MLKSIEGIYRNGKIEFVEELPDMRDDTPVIVTFLEPSGIDLRTRGIDETHAVELRRRLASFAEDWDSSEMDIYNDYDASRAAL